MKPSSNAATRPPSSDPGPLGLLRCRYTVPAQSASTNSSTKIVYSASALLRRMPACASSRSVPFIQSSPPGTSAMTYRNRSRPRADFLRRLAPAKTRLVPFIHSSPPGTSAMTYRNRSRPRADFLRRVARAATTMACDCSPSRRSLSGSSCARKSSMPVHKSRLSVAPVNRKRSRSYTIAIPVSSSYLDIGQLADHQNPHNLRTDRVGEELDAHRIGPQQPHILGLQNPEADAHHQRQAAQQGGRKTLLRGVRLQFRRHVQALAHQSRKVLQHAHHVGARLPLQDERGDEELQVEQRHALAQFMQRGFHLRPQRQFLHQLLELHLHRVAGLGGDGL